MATETSDLMKQGIHPDPGPHAGPHNGEPATMTPDSAAPPASSPSDPAPLPSSNTSAAGTLSAASTTDAAAPAASSASEAAAPHPPVPLREHVYNEAERIFKNTKHTKYQHVECIDETSGTYDVDCSEFVSYTLSRVAKRHLAMIPKESFWPVPRALMYYRFFASLSPETPGGWHNLKKLADARRGDIIAWEMPGEIRKDHDTGHVFIVAGTPVPVAEASASDSGQLMAVPAFDSAALLHYEDTREQVDGTHQTGVGKGTFHIRVDSDGQPVAFQFGPGDSFHTDPIAIGRIHPA